MATLDTMASHLEVFGQVSVLANDVPLQVDLQGNKILAELPDLRSLLRLQKSIPRRQRMAWAREFQRMLARHGLEFRLSVRGRELFFLTGKNRPGFLSRLVGMAPFEFQSRGFLSWWIRRGRHPSSNSSRI